jgi:hypothetical protein
MAHAAAAAVPLRRPLLLFLRPTRLLSSVAPPSSRRPRPRGTLRPVAPLPSSDGEDSADADAASFGRSRNEKKREARRAVQWGMELAKFSTPQIKRIVRAASLESEVLEALVLVKVRPLFSAKEELVTKSRNHCAIPGLCRNSGLMCGKEGGGSTITSVRMLIFAPQLVMLCCSVVASKFM